MNIQDLREAQAKYIKSIDKQLIARKGLYDLRKSFVRYFTPDKIRIMEIDEYVLGVQIPDNTFNFCYTIERSLDGLGRIIGANAFKFGVYFGKTKSDKNNEYRFAQKFGTNSKEAFLNVRSQISFLLDDGRDQNLQAIAENPLSPMFKGKILSTYFPEIYLNVFSPEHLNFFLIQLDLDTKENIAKDAVFKREVLLKFKNNDIVMSNWPLDLFSDFLYTSYPGRPPRKDSGSELIPNILKDYDVPDFPANAEAEFIELNILPLDENAKTESNRIASKKDYENEGRKLKRYGDRGEKLVMDIEYKRLVSEGREDLAKKIKRVSLESDSYGYDILSFDNDNKRRHIEVKATTAKAGKTNFFISKNEVNKAETLENYFIYMVYDITSIKPKVWPIKNPFKPKTRKVLMTPIKYQVIINSTRK